MVQHQNFVKDSWLNMRKWGEGALLNELHQQDLLQFKNEKSDETESYILLWQKHGSTSIAWFPEKEKSNADYREYWNVKPNGQKWTAQLNEDTYGKTGLGQRLSLGWMDGSKVRKWVAPELYATASNYRCTTVCFAFRFFLFGYLECRKHSTAEVFIKVKRIIKLLRFLQN